MQVNYSWTVNQLTSKWSSALNTLLPATLKLHLDVCLLVSVMDFNWLQSLMGLQNQLRECWGIQCNEDPGDDATTAMPQPIRSCNTHLKQEPISAITLTTDVTKPVRDAAGGASAQILRFDWLRALSGISVGLNRQTADVMFTCRRTNWTAKHTLETSVWDLGVVYTTPSSAPAQTVFWH